MILRFRKESLESRMLQRLGELLQVFLESKADLRVLAEAGIGRGAVAALVRAGFQPAELTWIRLPGVRQQEGNELLTPQESSRLLRLGRIYALALEVLGGSEQAHAWLRESRGGYAGMTFLELGRTDVGAEHVEMLLSQLDSTSW